MAEDEEVVFKTSTGPVRVITAASLFDGHDAAISVHAPAHSVLKGRSHSPRPRPVRQSGGRLRHTGRRTRRGLTSYQGGRVEYFTYIRQLLDEAGCEHVRIFGGGGGTITPPEIRTLHQSGISKIYSPDDGRTMGLMGMIHHLMGLASEVDLVGKERMDSLNGPVTPEDMAKVGLLLTLSESADEKAFKAAVEACRSSDKDVPVIGFTGTGGAGKSSLLDELMLRIQRATTPARRSACCAWTRPASEPAAPLLGDRIRMNSLSNNDLYMRSLASRGSGSEISANLDRAIEVAKAVGFDLIFCETSGIGQGSDAITTVADHSLYVMTAEFGAHTQLEKIEMLGVADVVILNKYEKRGSEDALRAIRKQVRRNRNMFGVADEELPVVATIANQFADGGVDRLWQKVAAMVGFEASEPVDAMGERKGVIPPERIHYLSEIRRYGAGLPRRQHRGRREVAPLPAPRNRRRPRRGARFQEHGQGPARADRRDHGRHGRSQRGTRQLPPTGRRIRLGRIHLPRAGKPFKVQTTTESLAHSNIPRGAAQDPGRRRVVRLHHEGECTGPLPLHRRRVPVQAHRRVVGPHVRR